MHTCVWLRVCIDWSDQEKNNELILQDIFWVPSSILVLWCPSRTLHWTGNNLYLIDGNSQLWVSFSFKQTTTTYVYVCTTTILCAIYILQSQLFFSIWLSIQTFCSRYPAVLALLSKTCLLDRRQSTTRRDGSIRHHLQLVFLETGLQWWC